MYFNGSDCAKFWNGVIFFNVLPDCVGANDGERDERFDHGTDEQVARAKTRFLRIVEEYRPDKILVFTAKGWASLPPAEEETNGRHCPPLSDEFPEFQRGTFVLGGRKIRAYGLRHPIFALSKKMTDAVQVILAEPLAS